MAPGLPWLHVADAREWVPQPPLRVDVETAGSVTTLRVAGELDLATVPTLAASLRPHLTPTACPRLLLDLGAVELLAAAGVHQLVAAATTARRHGIDVQVVASSHAVRRTLEFTGLTEQLTPVAQPRLRLRGVRPADVPGPRRTAPAPGGRMR
jgi:anti-anti-sigma factor